MSKWRDTYKVHPAVDVFPMMSDEELAELGEDIKAHGLKTKITFWSNGRGLILLDGRNRLEAMERAHLNLLAAHRINTTDDPVATIISLNIKRRHFTKQEQADYTVAALRAGEKAGAEKLCKPCTVSPGPNKGGRGKVNKLKARAIAEGKKLGIGKRTMQTALAKAEGKKPSKPHRRSDAEIERDRFLAFVSGLGFQNDIDAPKLGDDARDLLTMEQKADAVEVMESTIMRLQKWVDRLRLKDRS